MARANPQYGRDDYAQPGAGEWQDLRSELAALLDQVESQVARTTPREPGYQGLSERMRDLRHQMTEVEPETRHREALRSVQRAIDKFSERDEAPAVPRDTLQSAIQQIRTRHFPAAQPAAPEPPIFDELAEAVGGISARLERLEGELKQQARGQTANVKEIADQMGQLSQVVELLAGAVGETGQVKRLESQIAGLAKLIAREPQVDLGALTRRLDDVSATVAKLAELQKAYADRTDTSGLSQRLDDVTATVGRLADLQVQLVDKTDTSGLSRRLDDVTATVGRLADLQVQFANRVEAPREDAAGDGLRQSMAGIEDGVRSIYDRVDAIEKAMAVPPAELDKITAELARFATLIRQPQPQGLIELIDALNDRISDMETRTPQVSGLKADVDALRATVIEAMEPRFASLELQIEAIGSKIDARPEPNIAQLEAQVRQLVARMDQTGEQLTGLAKLYNQPAEREAGPDLRELAEMVAQRTSAVVAEREPALGVASLSERDIAELERRLTRVIETTREPAVEGGAALEATINEVNDRLRRLEDSVGRAGMAAAPAPAVLPAALPATAMAAVAELVEPARPPEPTRGMPAATAPVAPAELPAYDPIAPLLGTLQQDEPALDYGLADPDTLTVPVTIEDAMPQSPSLEAPLVDKPYGDPDPLLAALEVKNGPRRRHPGLGSDQATPESAPATAGFDPASSVFDPSLAVLPPAPKSSLGAASDEAILPPQPEAVEAVAPHPSRNTFIEAHRRAARLAGKPLAKPAPAATEPGSGSLIGRAFARFQASRSAEAKPAPEPVPPPAAEPRADKQKPAKTRKLAGDKDKPAHWSPKREAARVLPVAPQPSIDMSAEATSPAPDAAADKPQSFLYRHRQPILLGASVVALAFLTINLINQRMEDDAAVTAASQPLDVGDAALTPTPLAEQALVPPAAEARQIPLIDTLSTASIDPGAARGFVPAGDMPPAVSAFAAPATNPAEVADLSAAIAPLPATIESPVRVEMPPAGVGPQELLTAAASGDARAQFEVAAIYTEGRAVPEDLRAAAIWYERAAIQGFAPAQYRLGNLYENGRGVTKDVEQARLWYQRAAEAGNRMAMHNLAALYAGGGLGTQQFDAAAKWFEEAASRGMKDSQFNLGMLYARGLGVKQDLASSFKWFALAALRGDADAIKARDDIAASLDAATVQALEAEVAAFVPGRIDLVANFAPIGTWSAGFDPGQPIVRTEVVMGVQKALALLGFDVGTPDGVTGPKTAEAIRTFERATGMSESGTINPRLLAVLGSQPV
ncbi:peptidoglycan-binding protein [Devosia sp.]|uniref:peptidoglycan-binding protein n=1 Tax=Devosia sp. TaxID=1871048 RepID=UPI0035AE60A0